MSCILNKVRGREIPGRGKAVEAPRPDGTPITYSYLSVIKKTDLRPPKR